MRNIRIGYMIALGILFAFPGQAQEKIILSLNGYQYGEVQWQQSENGMQWTTIPGEQSPIYEAESSGFLYRAKITSGTCLPWYSGVFDPTQQAYEMVKVPGGTFTMGAVEDENAYENEKPAHTITVSTFYISKYEITNLQYVAFLNAHRVKGEGSLMTETNGLRRMVIPHESGVRYVDGQWIPAAGCGNNPVINVTWYGANEYSKWAGGRLPTEVEWEFAARGGNASKGFLYSGSDLPEEVAWYQGNAIYPGNVGQKQPNELGIHDLSGNVWEWCADWYHVYLEQGTSTTQVEAEYKYKIFRGGSCFTCPQLLRNTLRYYGNPSHCYDSLGFRIVKTKL